jgi:hypothetical protein
MNGKPRSIGPAAIVVALMVNVGVAPVARPGGPLRSLLPGGDDVPGWAMDGECQEYEGEDLFTYIDGGAEIYQEYGFRRVIVQDYENDAGKSISLEIFEMAAPAAAYGMFSFKRSGQGRSLDLGGGGELEDYYLNFWKGRFLATLTGFDETAGTVEGLLALAKVVDAKVQEGGRAPELVAHLPPEGLGAGSVKYLKGLLGLNNVYPFYTARGLAFQEAVRGIYEGGETLILLGYATAEARHEAWAELLPALESSGRFERPANALAKAVVFRDGKGKFVAFAEVGPRIAVGIHSDLDRAMATAARAR